MRLHVWGTDYRRGNAELRRRLYITPEDKERKLKELLELGFRDVIYLSTCNRVEFYTTAKDNFTDTRSLWIKLLNYFGLEASDFYSGYHLEGKSALRHLMRVACSLESLVLGEPQILGQLKQAHGWSKANGIPIDSSLDRAFHLTFETAKRVRTQTSIGEKTVSVAGLGLRLLRDMEAQYPLKHAVVVGRSEMNVQVVQWLSKHRPNCKVTWVNRNVSKLAGLVDSTQISLMSLDAFLEAPGVFSHLFTATSSAEPIFDEAFFKKVRLSEGVEPLFFDFAQPPDIDANSLCSHRGRLILLDDLREIALKNASERAQAVNQAEVMIENAMRQCLLKLKQDPVLRDFSQLEPVFLEDLESHINSLCDHISEEDLKKVRLWAEALIKKNLFLSRKHLRDILKSDSLTSTHVAV